MFLQHHLAPFESAGTQNDLFLTGDTAQSIMRGVIISFGLDHIPTVNMGILPSGNTLLLAPTLLK